MTIIKNIQDFLEIIENYNDDANYRYFYRGQSTTGSYDKNKETGEYDKNKEIKRKLEPSLYRKGIFVTNEHKMFRDIVSKCPEEFNNIDFTFNKLVKMQHYDLPTRLLDITLNPLVALYFACTKIKNGKIPNGKVYVFRIPKNEIRYFDSDRISVVANLSRIDKLDIEKYERIDRLTVDNSNTDDNLKKLLHEIRQEKPQFEVNIKVDDITSIHCVMPKLDNARIKAQKGAFFIFGIDKRKDSPESLKFKQEYIAEEIYIDEDSKERIKKNLQVLNITEESLFPEIERISKSIIEYYSDDTSRTAENISNTTEDVIKNIDNNNNIELKADRNKYFKLIEWDIFITKKEKNIFTKKYFNFDSDINVDKELFITLLCNSLSLDYNEKKRVIKEIPFLSQYQVDSLLEVWYGESNRFLELFEEFPSDIIKMTYELILNWYRIIFENSDTNFFINFINNLDKKWINEKLTIGVVKKFFNEKIIDKNFNNNIEMEKVITFLLNTDYGFVIEKLLKNNFEWALKYVNTTPTSEYDIIIFNYIATKLSEESKYKEALEYLEKIKDKTCILDYVEVAIIEGQIDEAEKYLEEIRGKCSETDNDYELIIRYLKILILIIKNDSEAMILDNLGLLENKISRFNSLKLNWNFREIDEIIKKYRIKTKINKFKMNKIKEEIESKSSSK